MKKFEEKPLSRKQEKALEMLINTNLKNYEIAKELQISPQTLSNWLNEDINPTFVKEYDRLLEQADKDRKKFYKSKAQHAVQKLIDLTESEDDRTALAACKEILDRAGDKPGINLEVEGSLGVKLEDLI